MGVSRVLSATERMERARERTRKARDETLAFVGMLTRMYPAHLCKALRAQREGYPDTVVCVHTTAGELTWKLSDKEAERFKHLPVKPNDHNKPLTHAKRIEYIDALTPPLRKTT